MGITHAKVSGLSNPADPDLVGGEDWDDDHVIMGPALLGMSRIRLTTGGAINTQSTTGFSGNFAKTGTGTYRANYDPADYGGIEPVIVACVSVDSGAPVFLRWTLENDGDDYLQLVTTDGDGVAVDVAAGFISLTASSELSDA
jgi:hypothetical protein